MKKYILLIVIVLACIVFAYWIVDSKVVEQEKTKLLPGSEFAYEEFDGVDPVDVPIFPNSLRVDAMEDISVTYVAETTISDVVKFYQSYAQEKDFEFKYDEYEVVLEGVDAKGGFIISEDDELESFSFVIYEDDIYEGYVRWIVYSQNWL